MRFRLIDITLLQTIDEVAALVSTFIKTVVDLSDPRSGQADICLARWPRSTLWTRQDAGTLPRVVPIEGPPFADSSDWGAAPRARHGIVAEIDRRLMAGAQAARSPSVTLDDYAQLHGIVQISLLLVSVSLATVKTLLGAGQMLSRGRIHAIALLAPARGAPEDGALELIAGVVGKFGFSWAALDVERASLAVLRPPPEHAPRSWRETVRAFGVPVTGVIGIGVQDTADLAPRGAAETHPLFLIDGNLPALERQRSHWGGDRNVTCIGAAVSDAERMLTLHVDAGGKGTYFATPEQYYRAHPQAGVGHFIEVTTCTLDSLAEKYDFALANVLTLDLTGGELASLRGAAAVFDHLDFIAVTFEAGRDPPHGLDLAEDHLSLHGFYPVPLSRRCHSPATSVVYARKERLWRADALSMVRRVMQQAQVSLRRIGCLGMAAQAALRTEPCSEEQAAFSSVELRKLASVNPASAAELRLGLVDIDVLVASDDELRQFLVILQASLLASRLCGIVVWGFMTESEVESTTRAAFDHGFLLDRASATATARAYLRSSAIRDPAGWLAANNPFGRRDFRCSALGQMGRFGNQLFQIMHLLLSSLRHNARASTCAWPHNDHFRLAFLERAGQGCTWAVAPGSWQIMGAWAMTETPDDIDFHAHLQWIAPFLSRHAAFINRCFELKSEWAARALQVVETLKAGTNVLTAFHVRRTDYLSAVRENQWHQAIPIPWYRAALERQQSSTVFAASDDLDYVYAELPGVSLVTYRQFADCGLPPLLIDHCVMRAADTLLMVNSTFSRTAGLMAADSQSVWLPSLRDEAFVPYEPWHDPVFWSRFEDRYQADPGRQADAVERWLAQVGVPQLLDHEKP